MVKKSPFDYINSIQQSKVNQITNGDLPVEDYNAFMVNRGLSMSMDTVLWAQEMNVRADMPPDWQYHFLHGLVKKSRRYGKWYKKLKGKNDETLLEILRKKYRYSNQRAEEIVSILKEDQKKILIADSDRGQVMKKTRA